DCAGARWGEQQPRAVDAGGREWQEFHFRGGRAGPKHYGVAAAGAGGRGGEGEKGAAVTAGGEDRHVGAEAMDRTVVELYGDDSAAAALFVHDQVDGEEFDEEFSGVAQRLAVHRVQHRMAGAVGGGTSALRG